MSTKRKDYYLVGDMPVEVYDTFTVVGATTVKYDSPTFDEDFRWALMRAYKAGKTDLQQKIRGLIFN